MKKNATKAAAFYFDPKLPRRVRRAGMKSSRAMVAMTRDICARVATAHSQAMERWLAHWYGVLLTPDEFARCKVEPGYCAKLGAERGIEMAVFPPQTSKPTELRVKGAVVARFIYDPFKNLLDPESFYDVR